MKSPTSLQFILTLALFALAGLAFPLPSAHAEDAITLSATLIHGSNDGSGIDSKLKRYEATLKRVLPFNSFKQIGSGRSRVDLPGSSRIGIGDGQTVSVEAQSAGDGKYRLAARWTKGGTTYINTTVVASKNRPTVLGGPSSGDGKLILLLVAN